MKGVPASSQSTPARRAISAVASASARSTTSSEIWTMGRMGDGSVARLKANRQERRPYANLHVAAKHLLHHLHQRSWRPDGFTLAIDECVHRVTRRQQLVAAPHLVF